MSAVSSYNTNQRNIEGERNQSPPASPAIQRRDVDPLPYAGEIYLATLLTIATVALTGAYVVKEYAMPLANRVSQYEANMSGDARSAISFMAAMAIWAGIMWAGGACNRRQ